ncbi:MAG: lysoplasmalogenase [Bacteroidota bacterium]
MLKKYLLFNLIFALIFLAQLITASDTLTALLSIGKLSYLTKPLITITLLSLLVYHTGLRGRFSKRIAGGLVFGLMGDVCLMFQDQDPLFFIYGLISFLIGHIFYITAFYLDYISNPKLGKNYTRWAIGIFGLFCLTFYLVLRPHLGEMQIPVLVYALVISLMAIMAVNRYGRINSLSFKLVFIGAILFLISDSLLAFDKFVIHFSYAGVLIMSTYMLAQYLITVGNIERKLKKKVK